MDPLTISMIASSIPAIVQGIQGISQAKKSKDILANTVRPVMETPLSQQQALQSARVNAQGYGMPGQVNLEQAQDNALSNVTGDIASMSTSSPDALAALVSAYGNRMEAQNEIGYQAANSYDSRQRELRGELGQSAAYERENFDFNEVQPYNAAMSTASALGNAGMINKFEVVKGIGGGIANYFGGKAMEDLYKNLPQGAGATPTGGATPIDFGGERSMSTSMTPLVPAAETTNTIATGIPEYSAETNTFLGGLNKSKNPGDWDLESILPALMADPALMELFNEEMKNIE